MELKLFYFTPTINVQEHLENGPHHLVSLRQQIGFEKHSRFDQSANFQLQSSQNTTLSVNDIFHPNTLGPDWSYKPSSASVELKKLNSLSYLVNNLLLDD